MGIIDTHSEYGLYDVVDGTLGIDDAQQPEGAIDYYGLHIYPINDNGVYKANYDGHLGEIDRIDSDDYDDVLELVRVLADHFAAIQRRTDDLEALVDYAGKIMTSDEDRAEEQPEIYEYVPEDV